MGNGFCLSLGTVPNLHTNQKGMSTKSAQQRPKALASQNKSHVEELPDCQTSSPSGFRAPVCCFSRPLELKGLLQCVGFLHYWGPLADSSDLLTTSLSSHLRDGCLQHSRLGLHVPNIHQDAQEALRS